MSKFKALTRKQKVEHIWEYYKLHIIGGILIGIFLISIANTILFPDPKPAANVTIVGRYNHDDDKVAALSDEMKDIIGDGEDEKVEVNFMPVDWTQESQMTMAMEQKLVLMIQTKEIDVLGLEKEKFDTYVEHLDDSMFESLEEMPGLEKILEENKENLVKVQFKNDSKEEAYGVFIADNIKLKEVGLSDNYLITIPITSENKGHAVEVIKWLYEK